MRPVAFSLGSNLGDREKNLREAIRLLDQRIGPLRVASIYETEPVSTVPQSDFLNTAAVGETVLAAEALLAIAHDVERRLGRTRSESGGPRTIDVDLLLVGEEVRSGPSLRLPHPRLAERRFVLVPLAEIAPGLPVPPDGRSVADLLRVLVDPARVAPYIAEVAAPGA